jgi:hypothetical protein
VVETDPSAQPLRFSVFFRVLPQQKKQPSPLRFTTTLFETIPSGHPCTLHPAPCTLHPEN